MLESHLHAPDKKYTVADCKCYEYAHSIVAILSEDWSSGELAGKCQSKEYQHDDCLLVTQVLHSQRLTFVDLKQHLR